MGGLARVAAAPRTSSTYEFENVPAESAAYLAARLPALPPPAALQVAQGPSGREDDVPATRHPDAGVPTRWTGSTVSKAALAATGLPAVIKTRRFGYDGKGQAVVRTGAEAVAAAERLGPGTHRGELRPLRARAQRACGRGRDGDRAFYPLTENHHRGGILRTSYAPAPGLTPALQSQGETLATRVLDRLDYVGVLAIELFQLDGRLLANEVAPRVHNSGHWTLDGAGTCQFENHVRAVTGMPLGAPGVPGPAAMVNLIGELPDLGAVAAVPGAHLHLYDKMPRPGRKLGHVNVTGDDEAAVMRTVERVWALLPGDGELPRATGW